MARGFSIKPAITLRGREFRGLSILTASWGRQEINPVISAAISQDWRPPIRNGAALLHLLQDVPRSRHLPPYQD